MKYPQNRYMVHEIANKATFFVRISVVFFALTKPASSIANPAAISITKAPHTRK